MISDRTMPPSERGPLREQKKAEVEGRAAEEQEALRSAMRRTFSTPDGRVVLKWIMRECQANAPILGANLANGTIDEKATLYQAMRLNLWLKIRRLLSFDILKEVEYEADQI